MGGIVVDVWWELSGRNRCCRMVRFKWEESFVVRWDLGGRNRCCRMVGVKWEESLLSYGGI